MTTARTTRNSIISFLTRTYKATPHKDRRQAAGPMFFLVTQYSIGSKCVPKTMLGAEALRRLSATALHKFRQPISVRLRLHFLWRHLICLIFFRHLAPKSLEIRQYSCGILIQSDEKIYRASRALSLCGIAIRQRRSSSAPPLRGVFLTVQNIKGENR